MRVQFQFLIGTIKTQERCTGLPCRTRQFQFLIGTIKTKKWGYTLIPPQKFQFLIGTIKTVCIGYPVLDSLLFQFLIGTIKTVFSTFLNFFQKTVSIPYRYDKNLESLSFTCASEFEFQFLIGTIKTLRASRET